MWHPRRLRQARRGGILSGMSGGICGHPTASGPPCTQPLPEGRTWCGQCKGPVGSGSHGADRNAARDAAAAAESALTAQPANSPASDLKIASDADIPSPGRQRDPAFAYCYFSRGDTDFDIGPLHDGRVLVETEQSGGYYGAAQVRFLFDEREAAILVTEFAQRFGWTGTSGNEAAAHVENDGLGADARQADTTERRASIGLRQPSAARAALSETGRQLLDAEAAGVNTTEEHAAFDKLLAEHEEALQAMRDGAPTFADSETASLETWRNTQSGRTHVKASLLLRMLALAAPEKMGASRGTDSMLLPWPPLPLLLVRHPRSRIRRRRLCSG